MWMFDVFSYTLVVASGRAKTLQCSDLRGKSFSRKWIFPESTNSPVRNLFLLANSEIWYLYWMLSTKSKSSNEDIRSCELISCFRFVSMSRILVLMGCEPRNLSYIDLGSNRTVLQAAAGGLHTCALLDNHAIKCLPVSRLLAFQTGISKMNWVCDEPKWMIWDPLKRCETISANSTSTMYGAAPGSQIRSWQTHTIKIFPIKIINSVYVKLISLKPCSIISSFADYL